MNKHKIMNAVFFQLIWFVCIYGASQGTFWQACMLTFSFILWECLHAQNKVGLLWVVAQVTFLGCILDTILLHSSLVEYQATFPSVKIAPPWILCLWAAFALTLNQSMSWAQNYKSLSVILGGILGPFTYWVADNYWGAIMIQGNMTLSLLSIGLLWSIATPLSLKIAKYMSKPTEKNNLSIPKASGF